MRLCQLKHDIVHNKVKFCLYAYIKLCLLKTKNHVEPVYEI